MMKMKRKDFDQFYDDFSEISLSSPASKIRRLNAELPPIMEEDDHPEIALSSEECLIQESKGSSPFEPVSDSIEGDFAMRENQERAIVLFKPLNPLLVQASTSSPLSVTVDFNLISGFKNEFYSSTRSFGGQNPVEDDDETCREADKATNKCTAVGPWVPSQVLSSQIMNSKSMEFSVAEAEAEEIMAMDIEQDGESSIQMRQQQFHEYRGMNGGWHQHHCKITQLPQTTSALISWFH